MSSKRTSAREKFAGGLLVLPGMEPLDEMTRNVLREPKEESERLEKEDKDLRRKFGMQVATLDRRDENITSSTCTFRRRKPPTPDQLEHRGKPRLLDLFCCAGGAGVGYSRAGFEVIGVDINPQPNYPFAFIQADALALSPEFLASFDAIHASPPCQSYSDLAKRNGNADEWPRLVEPVREMLIATGLPYVIENVDGAPLLDAVVLCGTMFPPLRVLRHRLFEANFSIIPPPHKKHPRVHTFDKRKSHFGKTDEWKDFVQVTGGGNCTLAAAREAMGIDWMTKGEINEAIPPAYAEFVGRELLRFLPSLNDQPSKMLRNA